METKLSIVIKKDGTERLCFDFAREAARIIHKRGQKSRCEELPLKWSYRPISVGSRDTLK
jgi:hypothetical protein